MADTKTVEKRDFLAVALQYHSWGLRPIPVDHRKIPSIPKEAHDERRWGQYQEAQSEEDVRKLFSIPSEGIAILTGINGVEVIDLDLKYDVTGKLLNELMSHCENSGIRLDIHFTVISTPSGGFHFIFKCPVNEGNQKLALRPATEGEMASYKQEVEKWNEQLAIDQGAGRRSQEKPQVVETDANRKPMVLIETRGIGGYIATVPGQGYGLDVGTLDQIPTIDEESRTTLLNCCRSFNQVVKYSEKSRVDRKIHSLHQRKTGSFEGKPSWEDYHEKSDPVQLLTERGWTISHEDPARIYLRRPGKSRGHSADYHKERKILAVWTTSTNLEATHYSPFSLYTELEHNGDFSSAAKQLYQDGYGDRQTRSDDPGPAMPNPSSDGRSEPKKKDLQKLVLQVEEKKFSIKDPIRNIRACLKIRGVSDKKIRKVASFGHLVLIQGKTGYGKSFLAGNMVTSGLANGGEVLSFRMNFMGRKTKWFDTEQPDTFFQLNQHRMFKHAGLEMDRIDYDAYPLEELSKEERFLLVRHHVYNTEGLGCIVIDGIADLCPNVNDIAISEKLVDSLRKWKAEKNILIIVVIHENPLSSKGKGHLGSILYEKCDALFRVTKIDQKEYQVNIPKSRFGPLPAFNFYRDGDGFGRTDLDDPDMEDTEGLIPMLEAKGATVIRKSFNGQGQKMNDDEDIPF